MHKPKSQRDLQADASKRLADIERIIDTLKILGTHPLDGMNALNNIRDRLVDLSRR